MKNSQIIALVILLIAVSVFVWIGAFSGDDTKNNSDEVIVNSPIGTLQTGSATSTPEPTPTAPANTEDPAATESAPADPTPVVFDTVSNADFEQYSNVFDYWSILFVTGEDNQNYPGIEEALANKIANSKTIPVATTQVVENAGRYIISNESVEAENEVYLTFSLSYEDGYTEEVLSLLESHGVKATFFVTKDYMESNPDMVLKIYNAGHVLGMKASGESSLESYTSETFAEELIATEKVYQSIVGETERMYYFRTTYFSERILKVAEALGYTTVFNTYSTLSQSWYTDTQDDPVKARDRLWERAVYDGAVPELTATKLVADALEMYLNDALNDANVTFKTLR
ncbi:MAG: polysaccharide deacetylase family protein [Clostridia bacterium]|nr:polysaccharide deacetylase family protein [Clostridia bacterium]